MNDSPLFDQVHFGGPDRSPGALRDVLEKCVEEVPAGGSIDWVTYYFRDRRLAGALLRAHRRGVQVRVVLSASTRTPAANSAVVRMLSGTEGLGTGLRLVDLGGFAVPIGRGLVPRLHEKIYCFSHPRPTALVGSFNPSDDEPEVHPEVIAEIGAHQRSWNVLVALTESKLVTGLRTHIRTLHSDAPGIFYRFTEKANASIDTIGSRIYFWPRATAHPVLERLERLPHTARVRIAASHLSAPTVVKVLLRLSRRGVRVEVLSEMTARRVTNACEKRLRDGGILFKRLAGDEAVPMHLKMVLVDSGAERWTAFGSFNWTRPSMWMNHEVALVSEDARLFEAFSGRWCDLHAASVA